jgi:hypothetical protein
MAEAFVMHGTSESAYGTVIEVMKELVSLGDLEIDRVPVPVAARFKT